MSSRCVVRVKPKDCRGGGVGARLRCCSNEVPCKLAWRAACYVGDEHGNDDGPQYDVVDDPDAAVHVSFGL